MAFVLPIPSHDNSSHSIELEVGTCLYVLGANGTGKSSLMQRFASAHNQCTRRISAHRQTWFSSSTLSISPEQKRQYDKSIVSTDSSQQSRWRDDHAGQRASIAIYELIDAQNVRARDIADAVDAKNLDLAKTRALKEAPIRIINELLRSSNIPVEISIRDNEEVMASKLGGQPYSVAELSDGERNALLIAANVLTANPGTLILIDEPERHLHRAITSPLLSQLFSAHPTNAYLS